VEQLEESRPWLRHYPDDLNPEPVLRFESLDAAWASRVDRLPGSTVLRYQGRSWTTSDVDRTAAALTVGLQQRGVRPGDRVGIYLQSVPEFVVTLLALWAAGGVAVPFNPMYRGDELRRLIDDADLAGMVVAGADLSQLVADLDGSSVSWLLTVGPEDGDRPATALRVDAFDGVVREHLGSRPGPVDISPDAPALICYTSGTTGVPKGAVSSHANVLHSTANFAAWAGIDADDVVLGVAPLFHISGVILNASTAVLADATLVLLGRFDPAAAVTAFAQEQVTTTLGSITAFNALLAQEGATRADLASVRLLFSGGAPVPPSTVATFQERFGLYIHNIWGMTETTAGGIAVPPGATAPVDEGTGSLSIGVPTPGVVARVVTSDGTEVPPGTAGELEVAAPQVVSGYWRNPQASAATLPGGWLRTGDAAVMDAEGWVYLVDRLKDQINTSGFKVWPREVEDVLYQHPAVFESAVVGEPDDYRGEAVVAYVALRAGAAATPDELRAFVRERLAAYKVPRRVDVVADLPKTATGKIRRAGLRDGD
jgi:long-chain acyl-CoA synthetase